MIYSYAFDYHIIGFEFFPNLSIEIFLSIKFKSAATVPGLGLKIKE